MNTQSLPSRERGLKYGLPPLVMKQTARRSLRGSVDWNYPVFIDDFIVVGRSLRGSVDWNKVRSKTLIGAEVAPFAGAWIEISRTSTHCRTSSVAPFAGAWIEIASVPRSSWTTSRRSLRGSVDWNSVSPYSCLGDVASPSVQKC